MQSKDMKGVGDSYNNLGNNLIALGRYGEALKYLMKGLQVRKQIGYTSGVVNSLMNLGNLYYYIGNQKKAESMYRECMRLAEQSGSFVNTGEIYNNIGALYFDKNKLDSAEYFFQKSFESSRIIDDYETILNAINNLAETKLKKRDFPGTLKLLSDAKKYIPEESNSESNIVIDAKFAQYFSEIGDVTRAIQSGNRALTKAKQIGAARLTLETEQLMAEVYAAAGRYQEAYMMQKSVKELSDSILNEKTIKSLSDFQYKYDIEQKEHEIDVLEKEQLYQEERNKKLTIAFTLSIFLLLVLAVALYVVYKNIQKQKHLKQLIEEQRAILEQHNEFKDKVFTIIAHDLRSPVASTLTMFNLLRSGIITDEQFREAQHDITNQIRNMSFLLDNLLNWAKKQMKGKLETIPTLVNVYKVIEQNSSLLQDVYYKKQITIRNQVSNTSHLTIDQDQFDFVVRNILANALKFSRDKGIVTISEQVTDNYYQLVFVDQGIGMDELTLEKLFTPNTLIKHGANGEQGTGLGLNISREFIELNNGRIEVSSELGKGSILTIHFPRSKYSSY
jgi:signal transduction histidine kinase/Tfp pilus assembly protein PilF